MIAKTFDVEALISLLGAAMAPHDEEHTYEYDPFADEPSGEPLVRYLIGSKGVYMSFMNDLSRREIEGLTGYASTEIEKLGTLKSGRRVWGLRSGKPLLPMPFTLLQLQKFNRRAGGACTTRIVCGDDTQAAISDLATHSSDAALLARELLKPSLAASSEPLNAEPTASQGAERTPIDASPKRRAYWRAVLADQKNAIVGTNGRRASAREVIKYLKQLGDPAIPNEGGPDRLVWRDDLGTAHEVTKKTVGNALALIRKEGPSASKTCPTIARPTAKLPD